MNHDQNEKDTESIDRNAQQYFSRRAMGQIKAYARTRDLYRALTYSNEVE